MTQHRRFPPPEVAALRFLIEDFADVSDDADADDAPTLKAARDLAREAAALLSPKQGVLRVLLERLPPAELQGLRRLIRQSLGNLTADTPASLRVGLTLWMLPNTKPGSLPLVESLAPPLMAARDVLWFYVANTVAAAGSDQIAVCMAPPSKHSPSRKAGACGRLYLRRGSAKRFCGPTCRARVATRRARGQERRR